jgi:uncharacterized protein YjdB
MLGRLVRSWMVRVVCASAVVAAFACSSSTSDPTSQITAVSYVTVLSGNLVFVGDTLRVFATPYSAYALPIDATMTWTSSATSVATVDETGLVHGVSPGTSTIKVTATTGSKSASASVAMTVATKSAGSAGR